MKISTGNILLMVDGLNGNGGRAVNRALAASDVKKIALQRIFVIARPQAEAIQTVEGSGLLRRFASRNDGTMGKTVIFSPENAPTGVKTLSKPLETASKGLEILSIPLETFAKPLEILSNSVGNSFQALGNTFQHCWKPSPSPWKYFPIVLETFAKGLEILSNSVGRLNNGILAFVIANGVKQSNPQYILDCFRLRLRNDGTGDYKQIINNKYYPL